MNVKPVKSIGLVPDLCVGNLWPNKVILVVDYLSEAIFRFVVLIQGQFDVINEIIHLPIVIEFVKPFWLYTKRLEFGYTVSHT
jgi:hypothetical protein